jgi:hypothetical protein
VLINPTDIERVVRATSKLGYSFDLGYSSCFAGRMHYLPIARTTRSGYCISLEIHLDAISPDQPDRLTFATPTARPVLFQRGVGQFGRALGHIDMLRHLSRHAFEPARRVRLIHLYDLWRYQSVFREEIDWRQVEARFLEVMRVLRWLARRVVAGIGLSRPYQVAAILSSSGS